jgi:hypothetical protein
LATVRITLDLAHADQELATGPRLNLDQGDRFQGSQPAAGRLPIDSQKLVEVSQGERDRRPARPSDQVADRRCDM